MQRRSRSQMSELKILLARMEVQLGAAFLAGAAELRSGLDFAALLKALRAGDIEGAIDALRIEPAAFTAYTQAKSAAFVQAAQIASATIVGIPVVRFDMTNPRAENWIARHVGKAIVEVVEETKAAARAAILSGFKDGKHPNDIALSIAGRVVAGRRTGGIVGLDTQRQDRLDIVSKGMASSDGIRGLVVKKADGTLQVRYKVGRNIENQILRAYRAGGVVPEAQRKIAIQQYESALLKSRAENIARTETAHAVRSGQMEQWRQLLDRRNLPDEAIIKTWVHGGGVKDPRPHHLAMNGRSVRGLETDFELPNGVRLKCPNDPDAPISETASCSCNQTIRIDHAWGLS